MAYQEITPEELYIRMGGLLFGTLASIIWILSSLKAEIFPDYIRFQVPSLVGILAFLVFVLIFSTLIYDFIIRFLLRLIYAATAGVLYSIGQFYLNSSKTTKKIIKFSITSISIILIILIFCTVLKPELYWQVSMGLILSYFVIIAGKIGGECLVPDKDEAK